MGGSDLTRNYYMLKGPLAKKGYDWWWHSFTGYSAETGEPKAFYIEYYVCNPALAEDKPVLGQNPDNQKNNKRPSYFMMNVGTWGKDKKQLHNFYPISAFSCPWDKLNIRVGECTLTEKNMKGVCKVSEAEAANPENMCDAGEMRWDIDINKKIPFNVGYGASKFFRNLNAFEMFWHTEGMCSEFSGKLWLDGVEYNIIPEKSYGYSDKNWGADFTSPWLWISSCNLTSLITGKALKNSVVNAGGGRPKVLGIPLNRKLLIAMYYEGVMHEYNFSKFWTGTRVEFSFEEGDKLNTWKVNSSNRKSAMELTLYCKKDEMLFINYEAPNGKKLHNRLWNGGTGYGEIKLYSLNGEKTLIDHIEMKNVGCEYGEYDK